MSTFEYLTSTLKQAGLRMTPQRLAICKLLVETDSHPTAAMIYESIRANYPSLSLTTVYNTLDTLADLGAINVLGHAGDDTVHYDADTTPHINLACTSCHKIIDIESSQVAHINNEISAASGYKLLGARVMYYGLCPACQKLKPQ
jgi:Fur family transcriptional regulator, peroxide stress response regulator